MRKKILICFLFMSSLVMAQSPCTLDTSYYNFKYTAIGNIVMDSVPGVQKSGILLEDVNLVQVQSDLKVLLSSSLGISSFQITRFYENGRLDKTYGFDGFFPIDSAHIPYSKIKDMELYHGNLYVLCENLQPIQNYIFALSSAGQLINSFGTNGVIKFDTVTSSSFLYTSMKISSTGDIFIAGIDSSYSITAKIKSTDGTLYSNFGTNGIAKNNLNTVNLPKISSIAIDSSGNVIITGSNTYKGIFVIKLLPNGNFDSAFNNGYKTYKYNAYSHHETTNVHVTSNGDYLITGDFVTTSNDRNIFSLKINKNGTTQSSYGTNAWSIHDFGEDKGSIVTSQITVDDKIIISSMLVTKIQSGGKIDSSCFAMIMLDSTGITDLNFASSNIYSNYITFIDHSFYYDEVEVKSSALTPDGKIILVGGAYDCSLGMCVSDGLVARYIFDTNNTKITKHSMDKTNISVFPNPFSDEFNIRTNKEQILVKIELFDIGGKVIVSEEGEFRTMTIKSSNLSKGIYFIKLSLQNNKTIIKKLIKK